MSPSQWCWPTRLWPLRCTTFPFPSVAFTKLKLTPQSPEHTVSFWWTQPVKLNLIDRLNNWSFFPMGTMWVKGMALFMFIQILHIRHQKKGRLYLLIKTAVFSCLCLTPSSGGPRSVTTTIWSKSWQNVGNLLSSILAWTNPPTQYPFQNPEMSSLARILSKKQYSRRFFENFYILTCTSKTESEASTFTDILWF